MGEWPRPPYEALKTHARERGSGMTRTLDESSIPQYSMLSRKSFFSHPSWRMIFGKLQGFHAQSGEVCLIAIFAASPVRAVVDGPLPPDRIEIRRAGACAGGGWNILSGI